MKILKLVLKNNIGIYDGLGRKEIEIDFNQESSENKITILIGRNGSGKTVILSHMTPFFETYDDRKGFIMEGEKEAYKELVIKDKSDIYLIQHFLNNNKLSSFIEKNGTQLNEKGGVRVFKSLIEEHLGLTSEFFKVGKVGSNVGNFIDLNSSDRKRFISSFVPDIEPYLNINKDVSERIREDKRIISYLGDELNKLESIKVIDSNINRISKSISRFKKEIETLTKQLASTETKIEVKDKELTDSGFDRGILGRLEALEEKLGVLLEVKADFEESNPKLSSVLDIDAKIRKYKDFILTNSEKIKSLTDSKNRLSVLRDSLNSDITTKTKDAGQIEQSIRQIPELNEKLDEATAEFDSLSKILDKLSKRFEDKYSNMSVSEVSSLKSDFNNIKVRGLELFGSYDFSMEAYEKLAAKYDSDEIISYLEQKLSRLRSNLEKKEREIQLNQTSISIIERNSEESDVLQHRPKECKIDHCGFIRKALKHKDDEQKIPVLQEKDLMLKEQHKSETQKLEETVSLLSFFKGICGIASSVRKSIILRNFSLGECSNPKILVERLLDESLANKTFVFPADLESYVYAKDNVKLAKERLESLNDKIAAIQDKESYIASIKKDLNKLNLDLSKTIEELTEVSTEFTEVKALVKVRESAVTLLENYKDNSEEIDSVKTEITNTNRILKESEEILNELKSLEADRKNFDSSIREFKAALSEEEENLDSFKLNKRRFSEYTEKLEMIEGRYEKRLLIKSATDVTSGIPVKLIDSYLNRISEKANELLDIAYGGSFNLRFKVDEKELTIPVSKASGTPTEDIALVSQGQKAMTKTTLSLAIFQRVFKRYDILSLDEIDSELDAKNRKAFLDILNAQIDVLNLEQVFVISHNQEFFSQQGINLILLPEHKAPIDEPLFMQGKTIVADFS